MNAERSNVYDINNGSPIELKQSGNSQETESEVIDSVSDEVPADFSRNALAEELERHLNEGSVRSPVQSDSSISILSRAMKDVGQKNESGEKILESEEEIEKLFNLTKKWEDADDVINWSQYKYLKKLTDEDVLPDEYIKYLKSRVDVIRTRKSKEDELYYDKYLLNQFDGQDEFDDVSDESKKTIEELRTIYRELKTDESPITKLGKETTGDGKFAELFEADLEIPEDDEGASSSDTVETESTEDGNVTSTNEPKVRGVVDSADIELTTKSDDITQVPSMDDAPPVVNGTTQKDAPKTIQDLYSDEDSTQAMRRLLDEQEEKAEEIKSAEDLYNATTETKNTNTPKAVVDERTAPKPIDTPEPDPALSPEPLPKPTLEISVDVREKFKTTFGLQQVDLETVTAFSELENAQQLKVLEQMEKLAGKDIKSSAIDAYRKDVADSKIITRTGKKIAKEVLIGRQETEEAEKWAGPEGKEEKISMLRGLAELQKDSAFGLEEKDGKTRVRYADESLFSQETTEEQKSLIEKFNSATNTYVESAGQSDLKVIAEAKTTYEESLNRLTGVLAYEDLKKVALWRSNVESTVKIDTLLAGKPELQDYLNKASWKTGMLSGVKEMLTTKGKGMAVASLARAGFGMIGLAGTAFNVFGTAVGVGAAGGAAGGYYIGQKRRGENFDENDALAEDGRADLTDKNRRQKALATIREARNSKASEAEMKALYEKNATTLSHQVDQAKHVVDSSSLTIKTQSLIDELNSGPLPGVSMKEAGSDDVEIVSKSVKTFESLSARVFMIREKLADNAVNLGKTPAERLNNTIKLNNVLAEAEVMLAMEKPENKRGVQERLKKFMGTASDNLDEKRKAEVAHAGRKGLVIGAVFGGAIAGAFSGGASGSEESTTVESTVDNKPSVPVVAKGSTEQQSTETPVHESNQSKHGPPISIPVPNVGESEEIPLPSSGEATPAQLQKAKELVEKYSNLDRPLNGAESKQLEIVKEMLNQSETSITPRTLELVKENIQLSGNESFTTAMSDRVSEILKLVSDPNEAVSAVNEYLKGQGLSVRQDSVDVPATTLEERDTEFARQPKLAPEEIPKFEVAETTPQSAVGAEKPAVTEGVATTESITAKAIEVQKGDRFYDVLKSGVPEIAKLDSVEQTNAIENIISALNKRTPEALQKEFGISSGDPQDLRVGDKIDLDAINKLLDEEKVKGMNIIDRAEDLTEKERGNIESNNAKLDAFARENPNVKLTPTNTKVILDEWDKALLGEDASNDSSATEQTSPTSTTETTGAEQVGKQERGSVADELMKRVTEVSVPTEQIRAEIDKSVQEHVYNYILNEAPESVRKDLMNLPAQGILTPDKIRVNLQSQDGLAEDLARYINELQINYRNKMGQLEGSQIGELRNSIIQRSEPGFYGPGNPRNESAEVFIKRLLMAIRTGTDDFSMTNPRHFPTREAA